MSSALSASLLGRTAVMLIVLAVALFGSAGRFDLIEFWLYLAIVAAVSVAGLVYVDPDLIEERMRPGGDRPPRRLFLTPIPVLLHLCVAGIDRGRFHWTDTVPVVLRYAALVVFAACWAVFIWSMRVNRFFSSVARIQAERGHRVITAGPYRFVRHPGYGAAIVAALASGLALGSWLATLVGALAVPLILWRALYEDRMLFNELPGYRDYAARVRKRFLPYLW
jgi:protein-S-isoprenylcysteine O-methyltransferase Ste14